MLHRPNIDTTDANVALLREALTAAAETLWHDGAAEPRRADAVVSALGQAVSTLRRMPDRDARFLAGLRSRHPETVHDGEDQKELREIWITMLERIKAGEAALEPIRLADPLPSPREVSCMWAVLNTFSELVRPVSRSQKRRARYGNRIYESRIEVDVKRRDWKVMVLLAAGASAPKIGKALGLSRTAVMQRRELQAGLIADALSLVVPAVWIDVPVFDQRARRTPGFTHREPVSS